MKWTNLINWPDGEVGIESESTVGDPELTGLWLHISYDTDEEVTPLCPSCEAKLEVEPSDNVGGFRVTCACEQPPTIKIPVKDD